MKSILFVCHGNICRSTMAEFVMKEFIRQAGLEKDFSIASAACRTDALGWDIHPGTKAKLRAEGIPFSSRQARKITHQDYEQYDYIIGMDEENMRDLKSLTHGDPQHKTHRLLDFTQEHRDVADPWYTDNFDDTYADISKGCQALLDELKKSLS